MGAWPSKNPLVKGSQRTIGSESPLGVGAIRFREGGSRSDKVGEPLMEGGCHVRGGPRTNMAVQPHT